MSFPHILTYLGRTLGISKLVSFTPNEEKVLKETGLYYDIYLSKMTSAYKKRALQLIEDVKAINPGTPDNSDYYRAQIKITELVKRFEIEFGLEKRLAQAS
jgi:hypothetical protein